jgi:hypothetical protein
MYFVKRENFRSLLYPPLTKGRRGGVKEGNGDGLCTRQEIKGIWISQAREEVGLIKNVPDAYADSEMDRNTITGFEEVEFRAFYKRIGVLYLTERTQLFTYDLTGHCNFTALRVNSGFKISFRKYDKSAMRGV